jgi:hypothetical protein
MRGAVSDMEWRDYLAGYAMTLPDGRPGWSNDANGQYSVGWSKIDGNSR